MKLITLMLIAALTLNAFQKAYAQDKPAKPPEVFEKVELLFLNGEKVEQLPVRLRLEEEFLIVESKKSGEQLKKFKNNEVKSAEYSHSRHPRWKSGTGTAVAIGGAAAAISPLLLLGVVPWMAIPAGIAVGKSKSKRHWLTIKTGDDYAVLKLDKDNRKLVIPAVETRTSVKVEDIGEKK
ncbi:MAG: hypothetical protein SF097_23080 [Acidobacteriota bacterium]|nr:hypothetical protein [Acidobacteriota bacterium]